MGDPASIDVRFGDAGKGRRMAGLGAKPNVRLLCAGLTPYEFICQAWTKEPERFRLDSSHHMPGPYSQRLSERWCPEEDSPGIRLSY